MPADFASVDYDRVVQINALVAGGADRPTNLTDEESGVWDNAVAFQRMATAKALTVEIPAETAGFFATTENSESGELTGTSWYDEVPVLANWAAIREVARTLGISRQHVHLMAQQGRFRTLHRLDVEGRPAFVISRAELEQVAATRARTQDGGSSRAGFPNRA